MKIIAIISMLILVDVLVCIIIKKNKEKIDGVERKMEEIEKRLDKKIENLNT